MKLSHLRSYFCIFSDLVNNFYLGDIVGVNTVDGVAYVLRGGDDDGEGQHAGGCQPGVGETKNLIINMNVSRDSLVSAEQFGRDSK